MKSRNQMFAARFARLALLLVCSGGMVTAVAGCAIPKQPREVYGARFLPDDWMSVATTDWRLDALPDVARDEVAATREAMRIERQGGYYRFYRRYTDAMLARIAATNQAADDAFLVSPTIVNRNLTPELFTTADTYDEARLDRAMNANQNLRGVQDDWERLWLLSKPSKLSNYPIQSTTGNP
jgi:hypothetical protein